MKYVLLVYLPGLFLGGTMLYQSLQRGLGLWVLLAWACISGLGVAVGFHRVFSHKTHNVRPWLDNLLLLFGTLGGQGSSISWVAVHRGYHHRFSDQPQDLHSPANGYWNALFGWYWNMKPDTINHKYAIELLRRPAHVWLHKHYVPFMVAFMVSLGLVSPTLFMIYMSALFISIVQDNAVNTLCHTRWMGYKNFPNITKDRSVNNFVLGYLGWGQGWHENHHAFPAEYDFGQRWWEFDPCRLWLPLVKLGSSRNKYARA